MKSEDESFKEKIKKLEKVIGIKVNNLAFYKEAFIHRSYVNENTGEGLQNNERLEFLGDAVLELVVSDFLFQKFPAFQEGELTSFRAALVKTESLAIEAHRLKLYDYLFLSKGEENTGGRFRQYILANTFESLLGAIFIDNLENGLELCRAFVIKELCHKIDKIIESRDDIDAKTRLQELSQEQVKLTPTYNLVAATGPDHNKTFEMAALIGKFEFGKGKGRSKQDAEQMAAVEALKNWDKKVKEFFAHNNDK